MQLNVQLLADLPGIAWPCFVRPLTSTQVRGVDATWPTQRAADDPAREWKWSEWARDAADRFVLTDRDDTVLGLWVAKRPTITLQSTLCYRLDFLEVCPSKVGLGLGAVLIGACCYRARQLAATRLVLAAFKSKVLFYRHLGAVRRKLKGWHHSPSLVPQIFEGERFDELCSNFSALVEEP